MAFPSPSTSKTSKNIDNDAMELFVWGSAHDLPSVDVQSIQAMAYARFGGAPVKVIECNNPWKSKEGRIPFFKHGEKFLSSSEEIASYIRQKNYSCDYGLTSKQGAEILAYAQLIEESLEPALLFYSFIHEANYLEVIRPAYGILLPWLYKMWYTERRLKQRAHIRVRTIYREAEFEPEQFEPEILVKAQLCIQILSDKLGSNDFFVHPNSPTTMDAVVFSYLAYFIKIPWLHCPLRECIKSTPNLERYVTRISARYFGAAKSVGPGGDSSSDSRKSTTSGKDKNVSPSTCLDDASHPWAHKFLSFFVATSAMLLFAYTNGMLRFRQTERFEIEDDEEEDWE